MTQSWCRCRQVNYVVLRKNQHSILKTYAIPRRLFPLEHYVVYKPFISEEYNTILKTSCYVPNMIYYDTKNELSLLPPSSSRSYSLTETDIGSMEMVSINSNFTPNRRFRSEPSQENFFLGKFLQKKNNIPINTNNSISVKINQKSIYTKIYVI